MSTNGMSNLGTAIFLETLYQKKFKRILTKREAASLWGMGDSRSFLALLGIPPIYEVLTRSGNELVIGLGNNKVYLCRSYSVYQIVREGKEKDKDFKSGRTDILTWNRLCDSCGGDFIDLPIPDNDMARLRIALSDEYGISL